VGTLLLHVALATVTHHEIRRPWAKAEEAAAPEVERERERERESRTLQDVAAVGSAHDPVAMGR
jgi:hypothetical protein